MIATTEAQLTELERLAGAATPGPWDCLQLAGKPQAGGVLTHPLAGGGKRPLLFIYERQPGFRDARFKSVADGEFAAVARQAVPELVAEVRRLRAELAKSQVEQPNHGG